MKSIRLVLAPLRVLSQVTTIGIVDTISVIGTSVKSSIGATLLHDANSRTAVIVYIIY